MNFQPSAPGRRALASLATSLLVALATLGASLPVTVRADAEDAALVRAIDQARIQKDVETLSSDEFEGRGTGTQGEERTVAFLVEQFKAYGLAPGNPDGTFVQKVPMSGFTPSPSVTFNAPGGRTVLNFPADFVAMSFTGNTRNTIKASELVFVGYGVVAPEYGWDDYKGVDLKGKTLVMLINDPPVPDKRHPGQLDPAVFGGKAMTYYGRWTYKYEMAAKLGAAGALIIHETKPAAYPYSVVRDSWSKESFSLKSDGANPDFPPVAGWLSLEAGDSLLKSAGHSYQELKAAALSRDFRPVPLGVTADIEVADQIRQIESRNVVARIEGSDPALRGETIIYSAHWDHFGWDPKLPGGKHAQIYHGALDNASGVAGLLAVARAFKAPGSAPRRSVLFVVTTGEEQGLLGAKYYATHPLYPLRQTLADINMDEIPVFGRTADVPIVGSGKSTLEDLAAKHAAEQGRTTRPDPHPEEGEFYRGDQLEFARQGVPVLYLRLGTDVVGRPAGYGDRKFEDFIAHDYHQVTDTVRPDWDYSGAVAEVELVYRIGAELAAGAPYPTWKPGAEFKAIREQSLALH